MNRKNERGKKMAVGRKGKISKGEEEAGTHTLAYRESEREREREEGWMLSCIDPSSPPSVTSLTCPTSDGVMIRLSFDHRR